MDELINIGLNAASGGVFGIIGTVLGRVSYFFERKQIFAQEQARWIHERELHNLNMQARAQEMEIELAFMTQQGSWRGLEASINADRHIGQAAQWVINCLRLVRPLLTLLLWIITAWIFTQTQNPAIGEAAVFAATAATLWWFGDRAPKPKHIK